ncbi:MAG: phosphodiester glycosidase family protein [Actinomycetota bacterium]
MKKLSVIIGAYLWLIFLFVSAGAQDFKTVQDGIEYAEIEREIDKLPVKMNLLRLDLTKVRLDVVHAMDAAIGTETTSSIATRHGALAAINAGFFRLDNSIFAGDAAGVLMIDGNLLSESVNNRIALGIINGKDKTEVNFGHLELNYLALIGKLPLDVNGVNRERKNDELILYTPEFNRSTLTTNGTEIIVINGKLMAIMKTGSNIIPSNGFVLSATGKAEVLLIKNSRIGAKVYLSLIQPFSMLDDEKEIREEAARRKPLATIDLEVFKKIEDITNGVPQLIKDGKIEITWEQEKSSKSFVETKHPRTAVAKLKDGKFLMVTVDGRSESSGGIGLEDLARVLLELGATDAMNLDGGGSSTMFLGGKIVNHPSDKEGERKVSDAILVFPRKKS